MFHLLALTNCYYYNPYSNYINKADYYTDYVKADHFADRMKPDHYIDNIKPDHYTDYMKPEHFRPLYIITTKHDEENIKKDKKKGFWNRFDFDFNQISIVKVLIFLLVIFISVAIGYQVRKSEEQSNYVRLPAA